ncbi:DegT/DnrJ/EryC1/StrS family aminotransferase [Yoonia sp.]|uniref:DegT/DnrJ/EryC1/StrS family aminotransferase n=1 Tax=Yoonia sp. TaxID=2212373 RepID=UPI0035C7C96A
MQQGQIISGQTDVRAAMAALDTASVKICLVVDAQGRLCRTLSDGDVRRYLLSGFTLETKIADLPDPCAPPVSLPQDASEAQVKALFTAHPVQEIVQLDMQGCPVGLVLRSQIDATLLLSPPHMGAAEEVFVTQAFRQNWIAPAGPNLDAFEADFARVAGRTHALAVSSGTAALHLALRVLDVRAHDPIYVSDLTFAASVQPVFYERAQPVLIDSEASSWNMSPDALARRLASDAAAGTLPKAIIVVHIYGQSANMRAICDLADTYGIPVIEDATESLGASYENLPSGAHGVMAAYSFNGNKMITTSGGGALTSDRPDLIARARNLSAQGREPAEHYQHQQIAYNYRMSNILAGIGRGQLEVLSDRVAARRDVYERYVHGFANVPGVSFQQDVPCSKGCRWLTVISMDPDQIGLHPYQFMRRLRDKGIETRPAWKPMHLQPLCAGVPFEPHAPDNVVSASLFLSSLCLPSGSALAPDQQDRVIDEIKILVREG